MLKIKIEGPEIEVEKFLQDLEAKFPVKILELFESFAISTAFLQLERG